MEALLVKNNELRSRESHMKRSVPAWQHFHYLQVWLILFTQFSVIKVDLLLQDLSVIIEKRRYSCEIQFINYCLHYAHLS